MIFEAQNYYLVFQDAVFSMAVGFVTGAFYQLIGIFFYKGRTGLFIKDVLTGIVFTTLIFSYSVSFANYPILRWYMVLFALAGLLVFPAGLSKWGNVAVSLMAVTVVHYCGNVYSKMCGKLLAILQKNKEKKQKITQKNPAELLKNADILMYN